MSPGGFSAGAAQRLASRRRLAAALLALLAGSAIAATAAAAPARALSAAPIVGDWSLGDATTPVLRVEWKPAQTTGAFVGTLLGDATLFPQGCLHGAGEVLFRVDKAPTAAWPNAFAGSGVVAAGDLAGSSDCSSAGSRVTAALSYDATARSLGLGLCLVKPAGGTACTSFRRLLGVGEPPPTKANWGWYLAPGRWTGDRVSFDLTAGGTSRENPDGRQIERLRTTLSLTCATWSPSAQKWVRNGSSRRVSVLLPTVRIYDDATLAGTTMLAAGRGQARLVVDGRFRGWTQLAGAVRYTLYEPPPGFDVPDDLARPGKLKLVRCDSGTVRFEARQVPGSWVAPG